MSTRNAHLRQEATPVDHLVGRRLRLQRLLLGVSQAKLGEALGVTFQQVQKYENGANRLSASKLQQAASLLHVPIDFFFEDVPSGMVPMQPIDPDALPTGLADFMTTREGVQLAQAFLRIKSARARRRLVNLIETLAEPG